MDEDDMQIETKSFNPSRRRRNFYVILLQLYYSMKYSIVEGAIVVEDGGSDRFYISNNGPYKQSKAVDVIKF